MATFNAFFSYYCRAPGKYLAKNKATKFNPCLPTNQVEFYRQVPARFSKENISLSGKKDIRLLE